MHDLHGERPAGADVRRESRLERQIVRQQGTVLTRPPFIYPFAFPANVWFAWRTGLPVDRYDLLAPAPLVASPK